MITKSGKVIVHVRYLEDTFKIVRHYEMKLNLKKCTFGVRSENFLGYMVDQGGIKANLDKVKAVLNMKCPTIVKEVRKHIGCIAKLGRFMSRSTKKCLPFFKVLKKKTCFSHYVEAEQAFYTLMEYLGRLARMVSLTVGELLFAYLVVSNHAVSMVLLVERD